jgi:LEA14-like dessication related protein
MAMNEMHGSFSGALAMFAAQLALFGCASQPVAQGPAPQVEVRVERMLPVNESLDESRLTVKLRLDNPTAAALEVKAIEYRLDTGELAGVVTGQSPGEGAVLEPGQRAEVEFSQSFPFPKEPEAFRAVIEKGSFPVTLSGAVVFADGQRVAFERLGEVVAPLLPRFVVHDAQAAQYGKSGVDVTFFLRLINENVFPITIDAVEYTLFIQGQEIKSEQGGIGTRLVAGAVQEFEVNTAITEKAPPALRAVFKDRRLSYEVKGKVSLARLEIPFELGGEISLAESSE